MTTPTTKRSNDERGGFSDLQMDEYDRAIEEMQSSNNRAAQNAARELRDRIYSQIEENFDSNKFFNSVYVKDFETSSTVTLSPLLASFAQSQIIKGDPNLWILLPDGERLGFKRLNANYWKTLKPFFGKSLFYSKVPDGTVVIFRLSDGRNYAVYKIQSQLKREQKIEFWETAEQVADEFFVEIEKG